MDLNFLPERIKAHKSALVNIVTPPVCTERAEAYTRAYQANEDKPVIVMIPEASAAITLFMVIDAESY